MPRIAFKPWHSLVLIPLLASCAVGPDYQRPESAMPDHYAAATPSTIGGASSSPAAAIDLSQWWQSLRDPQLDSLVTQAIKANTDIEVALDRLQEARTAEAVVLGAALPRGGAGGAAIHGTGNTGVRAGISPALSAATNSSGLKDINEAAGFDAVWELDLFGKYRRELEAASDDADAAAEARNAVLIAVVADVAHGYIDMRGLQMQLALTHREIATAQRSLDFVQIRYERGLTNELDLTLAQRELAVLQARIPPLEAGISAAQNSIAVLVGQFPEDMARQLAAAGALPPMPGRIDSGLPLDLLRRRPDIREAERKLAATTARIGVATADLYPHLEMSGAIGIQAQGLGAGPETARHIWSGGPSAYWSVLDFGTLDGLVQISDLQSREQLSRYKGTILNAVREVDTAISDYQAQQGQLESLGRALTASREALRVAEERYDRGLTDFLNVVDAERENYALRDQFAAAQQSVGDKFVALFRALGGGWENYQSVPPIRQPLPAVVAAAERLVASPDPVDADTAPEPDDSTK
jgi:NodT family efflux transporter outer membrane factor (OMF) lipoprotein